MKFKQHIISILNTIDYRETIRSLLVIFPGIAISVATADRVFLLSAFFPTICIMPIGESFRNPVYPFLMLSVIFPLSILFALDFPYSSQIFWLVIFFFSIVLGYFEANIGKLKKLSSWIFIGLLYGVADIKTNVMAFSVNVAIIIYSISVLGIMFYFILPVESGDKFSWNLTLERSELVHYSKYLVFFTVALIINSLFNFDQYQWFFWSGLSVLSLEFNNSTAKIKKRLISGSVGVSLGFAVVLLYSAVGNYPIIWFMGILLSLKAFNNYVLNFSTRCFFIVLFAGSQAMHFGYTRMLDVLAGGLIGLMLSFVLSSVDRRIHADKNRITTEKIYKYNRL